MNKSGRSYMKLTAVAVVFAITLIGLSGLLSATSIAQEKRTEPPREIDLHAKLKDKKFADGRRVVIDTLDSGAKIVAEVKAGDFVNWFLVTANGTEVKAEVKFRHRTTTTTTVTCTATVHSNYTTTDSKGKQTTVSSSWTLQIPCPGHPAGDTFK